MKEVRTLVLRAAGSNCDMETSYAFAKAGSIVERVHINRLVQREVELDDFDILALPGGFTYGDDIASGKILANEIKSHLLDDFLRFVDAGKLVIGICNGFQVLVKLGLLPNVFQKDGLSCEATLALNDSGVFTDRWVYLKKFRSGLSDQKCVWTKKVPDISYLPIAHAEGKFMPASRRVLDSLHENGQIVFQYCDAGGALEGYPFNPNGSVDNIAGVCDPTGRILGLMPHPERYITYLQHPRWQRDEKHSGIEPEGFKIIRAGVEYVKNNLERTVNG